MTMIDPLAPFQWLAAPECRPSPLNVIFSVAFFRRLDPVKVVRRFSRGEDLGKESDFAGLDEAAQEFVDRGDGGDGGGHVGVFQEGEWSVAVEPIGWMVTLHEVLPRLSRGCEVVAVTRHDYAAEHSFEYAVDGESVTGYRLRHPHDRYGSDPDRLNDHMRELGMALEMPEGDDAACDAVWQLNYDTAVPRAFALAARITGVSFTPDLLDRPMLVGPVVDPFGPRE
ncbi:DUF6461 domain-containing protein [Nonomuraea sp. LP-02]|uniref:DUF6461 domain-containing protein n=1 Tax=Nonomuraea sp. LP-02 TaxID=3097960 RepID=UPI002E37A5C9|nr:DUF6461 domain-containing protein [Nonomuraea sp. LP-02]MED7924567.1 DUF6461 domain-containing protein [Nonomuraea sp. LP-02]